MGSDGVSLVATGAAAGVAGIMAGLGISSLITGFIGGGGGIDISGINVRITDNENHLNDLKSILNSLSSYSYLNISGTNNII